MNEIAQRGPQTTFQRIAVPEEAGRERFRTAPTTDLGRMSDAPKRPRLGCAGIVRRGEEILLGKRDKEPNRGLWVLPGGGVDFGESFAQTVCREVTEEAGIDIDFEGIFRVYEIVNPPAEHRVIVYVHARHRSGEPKAASDLSDVRFFGSEELRELSAAKQISPFVENVLREASLL